MNPVRIRERIEAPQPLVFEMTAAVGGTLPGAPAHTSVARHRLAGERET